MMKFPWSCPGSHLWAISCPCPHSVRAGAPPPRLGPLCGTLVPPSGWGYSANSHLSLARSSCFLQGPRAGRAGAAQNKAAIATVTARGSVSPGQEWPHLMSIGPLPGCSLCPLCPPCFWPQLQGHFSVSRLKPVLDSRWVPALGPCPSATGHTPDE